MSAKQLGLQIPCAEIVFERNFRARLPSAIDHHADRIIARVMSAARNLTTSCDAIFVICTNRPAKRRALGLKALSNKASLIEVRAERLFAVTA